MTKIRIELLIILLILSILQSCGTMTYKVIESKSSTVEESFESKNKFVRVDSKYETAHNWYSKNIDIQKSKSIHIVLMNYLAGWGAFDIVHPVPSLVEEKLHPRKFDDDYIVELNLKEEVTRDQGALDMFLRFITLGFYKQRVEKKLEYDLKVTNRRTNKLIDYQNSSKIEIAYQTPMLIFPINMDKHPFTTDEQAYIYLQLIKNDLSKIFNFEVDEDEKVIKSFNFY